MDVKETSPGGIEALRGRLLRIAAANGGRPAEASSEPAPREPPPASDLLPLSDVGQEASALAPERQFLLLCVELKGTDITVLEHVKVGAVSSDQVLFRDIRNAYEQVVKEHGWTLGMLSPPLAAQRAAVRYSEISLENSPGCLVHLPLQD